MDVWAEYAKMIKGGEIQSQRGTWRVIEAPSLKVAWQAIKMMEASGTEKMYVDGKLVIEKTDLQQLDTPQTDQIR